MDVSSVAADVEEKEVDAAVTGVVGERGITICTADTYITCTHMSQHMSMHTRG